MRDEEFSSVLQQLRDGKEEVPWPRRLEVCRALKEALAAGASTAALELVDVLAADPKWEVRQAVAQLLDHLGQGEFLRLAGSLVQDANDLVRQDARKALDRRRKVAKAQEHDQRVADQISQLMQWLEGQFGKSVARKAQRYCERYTELVVGSIVHDLRSILTNLETNCAVLVDEYGNGEPGARAGRIAKRMEKGLEFLGRTIRDMETFTQSFPPDRHPERLASVVEAALESARVTLRKLRLDPDVVEVQVKIPQSLVVQIARHRMELAIANVVKNAYESFTTETGKLRSGRIRIRAKVQEGKAVLTVQDNGMGMSKQEQRELLMFTPRRRNKMKKQSTGYGLPITLKSITAHGGTLNLESRENRGTTVTLTIPVNADAD